MMTERGAGVETRRQPTRRSHRPPGDEHRPVITVTSATELVYQELRQRIIRGLQPGSPLRLNDLAAQLGVSVTPIRGALERLVADGLAAREHRKGTTVALLSLDEFLDIYAIREGIEGVAAGLGAAELNDGDLAEMKRLFDYMDTGTPDLDTYLVTHWQMHDVCFEASARRRLVEEIRSYRRQAERYLRLALADPSEIRRDMEHQRAFLAACERRDAVSASALIRSMLKWTVVRVVPRLGELGK